MANGPLTGRNIARLGGFYKPGSCGLGFSFPLAVRAPPPHLQVQICAAQMSSHDGLQVRAGTVGTTTSIKQRIRPLFYSVCAYSMCPAVWSEEKKIHAPQVTIGSVDLRLIRSFLIVPDELNKNYSVQLQRRFQAPDVRCISPCIRFQILGDVERSMIIIVLALTGSSIVLQLVRPVLSSSATVVPRVVSRPWMRAGSIPFRLQGVHLDCEHGHISSRFDPLNAFSTRVLASCRSYWQQMPGSFPFGI